MTYRLAYRGAVDVTYALDVNPTFGDFAKGRLSVQELTSSRFPMAGGGLTYMKKNGALVEDPRFLDSTLTSVEAVTVPNGVQITVHEQIEGGAHAKRYTLNLVGRSLEVHAQSLDPPGAARGGYAGFTTGGIEGTSEGVTVRIPYMDAVPITMLDRKYFASTLLDYPKSQATGLQPRGPEAMPGIFTDEVATLYEADTQGHVNPVDDTLWVTVSPLVEDVFAVPAQPPSPYLGQLGHRVHVSFEGRPPTSTFEAAAQYLEGMQDLGVTDLVVDYPDWVDGASPPPQQGPPDVRAGGAVGFARLASVARGMGALLAAGQALSVTVESCPGKPNRLYRAADRVLDVDGQPKQLTGGKVRGQSCGVTDALADLLPPDAAKRTAQAEAGTVVAGGVTATWLDTLATKNPAYPWPGAAENVLDRAAPPGSGHPATLAATLLAYKQLFQSLQRQIGPLFSAGAEGAWAESYDTFYTGYVDGVARSLVTGSPEQPAGSPYLVIPDYELAMVKPRMANYGMGAYRQFFDPTDLQPIGGIQTTDSESLATCPESRTAASRISTSASRSSTSVSRSQTVASISHSTAATPLLSDAAIDSWRATSLAYGHAGAWSVRTLDTSAEPDYLSRAEQVKEYYVMHALQAFYVDAPLVSVGYFDPSGTEHDLDWALTHDLDLANPRLHLTFGNPGRLELWINHSANVWTVGDGGQSYLLPLYGWLAHAGSQLLGYSALVDGQRVDYLRTPDYTLADGRGRQTFFDNLTTRDLKIVFADGRVITENVDGTVGIQP